MLNEGHFLLSIHSSHRVGEWEWGGVPEVREFTHAIVAVEERVLNKRV